MAPRPTGSRPASQQRLDSQPTQPTPPRLPSTLAVELAHLRERPAPNLLPGDQAEAEWLVSDEPLEATGCALRQCALELTGGQQVALGSARLVDCRFRAPDLTGLDAREASWLGVRVSGGRIGALDAPAGYWNGVEIIETRIGYLSLRQATVSDVVLTGAHITTLDLTGATATRLRLTDCHVGELLASHSTLTEVDLRGAALGALDDPAALAGAVVSPEQLVDLAPALARALRVRVLALPAEPEGR